MFLNVFSSRRIQDGSPEQWHRMPNRWPYTFQHRRKQIPSYGRGILELFTGRLRWNRWPKLREKRSRSYAAAEGRPDVYAEPQEGWHNILGMCKEKVQGNPVQCSCRDAFRTFEIATWKSQSRENCEVWNDEWWMKFRSKKIAMP